MNGVYLISKTEEFYWDKLYLSISDWIVNFENNTIMLPVGIEKKHFIIIKLNCILVIKHVRRNPIGNEAVSTFSVQKLSVPESW